MVVFLIGVDFAAGLGAARAVVVLSALVAAGGIVDIVVGIPRCAVASTTGCGGNKHER